MTSQEAGVLLGKSAQWVRLQCATGQIKATFYGGSYNITPEAVEAYLASKTVTVTPGRRSRRLS